MNIFLASDHAGYDLKNKILNFLKLHSFETSDLGPNSDERVDYPDFATKLCLHLKPEKPDLDPTQFGILICGSGQGMAMKANKYFHIRAALCWDLTSTKLSREHNNANILCIGGRLIPHGLALEMVEIFLKTKFSGNRHSQRVIKLSQ